LNATIPSVSVIVPHYADLARLDLCLAALDRQRYPRELVEVIVADNGSPGGEDEVARVIAGRARLVVVNERGAGPARIGGAAIACGEVLAFTDSDCVPDPDWIAAGVTALRDCDYAGGQMKVLVERAPDMSSVEAFETVFAFDNKTYVTRKGFTVTANLFCRRAIFAAVGGFSVGISEDIDWSHRARDAGYRIGYAEHAVVGHPARRNWSELEKKWRRINEEMYALAARRPGGEALWLARTLVLPLSALAHTPRPLFDKRLHGFGQRLAALGVLYRLRLWRFGDVLRLTGRRAFGRG
jgi:GT2 family glycosyltransferase